VNVTKRFTGNFTLTNDQKNALIFVLERENTATGEWDEVKYLYPDENGDYYMVDDTEHTLWLNAFQVECYIADGFEFVDASNEEAEPVVRTAEDLIAAYDSPKPFLPDNMQITFDDNCRVTRVTYLYSPWN
jgi:hypothetical protein